MANKFDNKAETPSPIKSSGIKNRYIADEDDGGEGSFDNLIGKVTTPVYKQNEQQVKQFDQFGRRLNQTSAPIHQSTTCPLASTGYESMATTEISTTSSITSFSRDQDDHDMFPLSGFKRTTSFDNFNEINYSSKQTDQAMKKGTFIMNEL